MPALNSLRAFEAAARLSSISEAAAELFVTPSAVAQQVKALEEWAGGGLFRRKAQGISLTPLGESVRDDFSAAFDALGLAVHKLRVRAAPSIVRIAALPAIAQLWLSPRLPAIRAAMPDVRISVTALERPPKLGREPFDFALFYDEGEEHSANDGTVRTIAADTIFPVCAPQLAGKIKTVGDLADTVLLRDTTWKDDWAAWLAAAGPGSGLTADGPEYSLYALALEECCNGAGVLIGHRDLVQAFLDDGRLVAPFDRMVSLPRTLALTMLRAPEPNSAAARTAAMLTANA